MLRVNVGLSRKISHDFNSTGCSVNLDGEVFVPLDDPEGVLEKIREFYDLAEEALKDQLERYRETRPQIASPPDGSRVDGDVRDVDKHNGHERELPNGSPNGHRRDDRAESPPATNKQIQYLLTLGKRQRLTKTQLERRIESILGSPAEVYDLNKQQAGVVIESLMGDLSTNSRRS